MRNLTLLLFLAATHCTAYGQSRLSSPQKENPELSWAKVEWEDDSPYRQARASIDSRIQSGTSAAELASKFDRPFQLNDTLTQFKWGYASYEEERKTNFTGHKLQEIKERLNFVSGDKTPRSAEFNRLLFLVCSRLAPNRGLADIGQRLVKRYPNDFEVKWFAFYSLTPGRPSHYPVAVAYAKDLKRRQPNKPESIFLLSRVYTTVWATTWARKDADKAIAEYRSILASLPANDPRRKYATMKMNWVQRAQPGLEKKMYLRPPLPKG